MFLFLSSGLLLIILFQYLIVRSLTIMCLADVPSLGFNELLGSVSYWFCFLKFVKFGVNIFSNIIFYLLFLFSPITCVFGHSIVLRKLLKCQSFFTSCTSIGLCLFTFLQIWLSCCVQYAVNPIPYICSFIYYIFQFHDFHFIQFWASKSPWISNSLISYIV